MVRNRKRRKLESRRLKKNLFFIVSQRNMDISMVNGTLGRAIGSECRALVSAWPANAVNSFQ